MKSNRSKRGILSTTLIAVALLAVLPMLLTVYLFELEQIAFTEMIVFYSGIALLCVFAGYALLKRSSDKIRELSKKTTEFVEHQHISPIALDAEYEIQAIADNFNSLTRNLKDAQKDFRQQSGQLLAYAKDLSESYRKIREEEAIKEKLSQYVGQNVVNWVIESKGGILSRNEKKEVTVLFADIRAFTQIAETTQADEIVDILNEFFSLMVEIIFKNYGVLDKFIGDQVMAVFGIISSESPHLDAVKTALEMQDSTENLMKKRAEHGKKTFEIGIGVNTGDAIIGNVGSENRKNYTVVGDSVNVAGRLQQLAKGGEIAVGEKTYSLTKACFNYEKMGRIHVKSRSQPVAVYKLVRGHGSKNV
ncbi:MAG: adenylate/guanylate cyclase domain-containing protein [Desulfobacterales bacterium]